VARQFAGIGAITGMAMSVATDPLAQAQKSLSDAQTAAQTENARKSYQIASKFDTALNLAAKPDPSDLDKSFAAFITGK